MPPLTLAQQSDMTRLTLARQSDMPRPS
jgi:hypothetical protein